MPLAPGSRLGTYEILAALGAGGMGEVYRARDTRLRRDIAIKVLPEAVANSPDRLARFEQEARTVAGLNHPNIVTLFTVEDEGGFRFLTMELVEGQSLTTVVTPGGLPFARVLELSIPLVDALVAAHERGIVHRDLKPGNVMVTREGRVKLLDFGLAKAGPREGHPDEPTRIAATNVDTMPGQIAGTVPYMAPEQIRGEPLDARTDLFALGTILYELTTGRRPFGGDTRPDLASSILRDAPVPVTTLRQDTPQDLARVIAHCLEKKRERRAQTAKDVRSELESVLCGVTSGEAPIHPLHVPPVPASGIPSIAVLPFVNRSRGEEDEYFSDGLADELLNVLTKINGLRVAARASSFQFRERNEDIAVIGERLRVATILDGSVRKAGNRVRIGVQLVNVSDGYHLWSEVYDRTLDDIFAVQDDIARSVVTELRAALMGDMGVRAKGAVKADVEAAQGVEGISPRRTASIFKRDTLAPSGGRTRSPRQSST